MDRDRDCPTRRHRVAGVEGQIHDDLLELSRVDAHPRVVCGHIHRDDDLPEEGGQYRQQSGDHDCWIDVDRHEHLPAGEGEELAGDGSRALGALDDLAQIVTNRIVGGQAVNRHRCVAVDRCEQIVEVVGDPPGELADGLQALALHDLGVDTPLARHVADIQHRPDEDVVLRHDRAPRDEPIEVAAIGPAEADLHPLAGVDTLPGEEAHHLVPPVGRQKLGDLETAHLVERYAEQRGHGRVGVRGGAVAAHEPDAIEHAVEDRPEPVCRHLADGGDKAKRLRMDGPRGGGSSLFPCAVARHRHHPWAWSAPPHGSQLSMAARGRTQAHRVRVNVCT